MVKEEKKKKEKKKLSDSRLGTLSPHPPAEQRQGSPRLSQTERYAPAGFMDVKLGNTSTRAEREKPRRCCRRSESKSAAG